MSYDWSSWKDRTSGFVEMCFGCCVPVVKANILCVCRMLSTTRSGKYYDVRLFYSSLQNLSLFLDFFA
jgi:hypothetical protein